MRVSKDVLGIIILKLSYRDVLNLRATCKDFRDVIATFNKFWFLKYLKRWEKFDTDQFDRYLCTHINHSFIIGHRIVDISHVQCLTPDQMREHSFHIIKEHEKYNTWSNEFKSITDDEESESLRRAYIIQKYLKDKYPNHKCTDLTHLSGSIDEKYLEQTNINVINDALKKYCFFEFSYFDVLINFKPKHERCSYCKTMYPDNLNFFNIHSSFVNLGWSKLYWKNLEKDLKIEEYLCSQCVRDFQEQGFFLSEKELLLKLQEKCFNVLETEFEEE